VGPPAPARLSEQFTGAQPALSRRAPLLGARAAPHAVRLLTKCERGFQALVLDRAAAAIRPRRLERLAPLGRNTSGSTPAHAASKRHR
jgi:hypothetical protein